MLIRGDPACLVGHGNATAHPGPPRTVHGSCRTTPDHTRFMPDHARMNTDHPGPNTVAIRMSTDCPGPARMNTVALRINTVTLRIVPDVPAGDTDDPGSPRTSVQNDIKGMRFHIKITTVFDSTPVTRAEMSLTRENRLQLMGLQLHLRHGASS